MFKIFELRDIELLFILEANANLDVSAFAFAMGLGLYVF